MRTARLASLCLAFAIAMVVVQTGAFSTTAMDSGIEVSVADDATAYFGVDIEPVSVPGDDTTRVAVATVTNRFQTTINVIATATETAETPPSLSNVDGPGALSAGESGVVDADVTCDDSASQETVELTLNASGPDVGVTLTRTVTVTCGAVETEATTTTEGTENG